MKRYAFLLVAAALGVSFAVPGAAATLNVNGSGQLTGATGVNVNGALYDVTFSTGSCNDAYNGCNSTYFTFSNSTDAQAAAQALLDQVFIDGSAGQFDSAPALTAGCLFSYTCRAAVPYGFGTDNLGAPVALSMLAMNDSPGSGSVDQVFGVGDPFDYDATKYDAQIWTHFTPESAVPEPSTWALMLLGFGAISATMRRNRRSAALPQIT